MGLSEREQNLNISPEVVKEVVEVVEKEEIISKEEVLPEEAREAKKEPKPEKVSVPFLKGVKIKIPEGIKINWGNEKIKKEIKEFIKENMRYVRLWNRGKKMEKEQKDIHSRLDDYADGRDYLGVEVEKKDRQVETTIHLTKPFVKVKDEELVRKTIPEEYHSKLLVIDKTPPTPSKEFLVLDYKRYKGLLKKKEVPRLPKEAIDKPSWSVDVVKAIFGKK